MFTQFTFAQESKQNVAVNWLNDNVTDVKTNQSFDMNFSRPGKSGETFRYYHTVNGVEVYDPTPRVYVKTGESYFANGYLQSNITEIKSFQKLGFTIHERADYRADL